MRVLLDGAVFARPAAREASDWWCRILPHLLADFAEGEVVFVERLAARQNIAFGTRRLWAPDDERLSAATEDRRLRALCREVGADRFVSTYGTSAGAGVPTLVVLPAIRSRRWISDDGRVLRLGWRFVTFAPWLDRKLARLGIRPEEIVRWPDAASKGACDHEAAAAQGQLIAEALRQVSSEPPSLQAQARRQAAAAALEGDAAAASRRSLQRMLKAYRREGPPTGVRAQFARALRIVRHPLTSGRRFVVGRPGEEGAS